MTTPLNIFQKWFIAVRPFAYSASISPVLLGLAIAYCLGHPIHGGLFAATFLCVICFHTSANLFNDIYDFQRGLDTTVFPTSGAVVRGILTEGQVRKGAIIFLGLAIGAGMWLLYKTGFPIILLTLTGTLLALSYTGKQFCLKYAGWGDVAILIAFGPLPVLSTYWVQTQTLAWLPILWFLPVALLAVGILHANNWRDRESDWVKGCHTVAGRLGANGSATYYRFLVLAPYLLTVINFLLGWLGPQNLKVQPTVFLVFLSFPLAIKLARIPASSEAFKQLDGETAKLQLIFSLLLVIGFVTSKFTGGI